MRHTDPKRLQPLVPAPITKLASFSSQKNRCPSTFLLLKSLPFAEVPGPSSPVSSGQQQPGLVATENTPQDTLCGGHNGAISLVSTMGMIWPWERLFKGMSPRTHTSLIQGYSQGSTGPIKAITCSIVCCSENHLQIHSSFTKA